MYTCTEPFPNFYKNLSRLNKLDICDVTFIGGGGFEKITPVVTSLMDSPNSITYNSQN